MQDDPANRLFFETNVSWMCLTQYMYLYKLFTTGNNYPSLCTHTAVPYACTCTCTYIVHVTKLCTCHEVSHWYFFTNLDKV